MFVRYNRSVARHFSRIVVLLLLMPLASAANDLAAMGASSRAHACCAKTRYACAGLKSADDCCKRMGHAAPPAPATTTKAQSLDTDTTGVIVGVQSHVLAQAPARRSSNDSFKRPHDPPHLHTFTLLI
jgi:hypothetical protein